MNSSQAKVDLCNSGQPSEAKSVSDKSDAADKQHGKKTNLRTEGDKKNESGALVPEIYEKYNSFKQGNFKAATKPITSKSTVKNSSLESPVPSSSLANAATKSHKLVNSDSGIDSTGTDVSTGTLEDSTSQLTSSNTPNKRSAGNNPITNGSLTESLTRTDGVRTPNLENLSKTNLYIRGLPATTTDEDLYNMCAKYGTILSTKAIFDKATGSCRGYGFVQYTTPQSAEVAVIELNKCGTLAQMARLPSVHPHHNQNYAHQHHHHHHHHQTNHHVNNFNHNDNQPHYSRGNASGNINSNNSLTSHESHQNNNHADPTNLYIANLPLDMSEDDLGTLLSTYGPVISTRILRDERNMTRGVGFARMETRDKCQEVIEKLNGKPFKGSKELLLVKFADGGNRKRHHYQNNHHSTSHHHQHHQKYNHEDHRWIEGPYGANPNSVSNFEQHGNISHNNQIPDISMMGPLSYQRMPQPYPPNMNPPPGYPATPESQAGLQWIHQGQPWNVIPQQMIQPAGLGGPNQAAAASSAYPFAHIPQLTSQMQGLQIAHHPAAHMSGYLPAHHQWPVWPQPVPHQQPSVRLANPQQNLAGLMQHQPQQATPQQNSEPTQAVFVGGQEGSQDVQKKQSNNPGEQLKQVRLSTPIG